MGKLNISVICCRIWNGEDWKDDCLVVSLPKILDPSTIYLSAIHRLVKKDDGTIFCQKGICEIIEHEFETDLREEEFDALYKRLALEVMM